MNILCGYANDGLRPQTRETLEQVPGVQLVDLSGDMFAYWREVRARWQGEEDLITVEQDISFTREQLDSLAACDQDWCSCGYQLFGDGGPRWTYGLGFTRFSAALQRRFPAELIEECASRCYMCKGTSPWQHIDMHILWTVKGKCVWKLGGSADLPPVIPDMSFSGGDDTLEPHDHGDVGHLHVYSLLQYRMELPPPEFEGILRDFMEEHGRLSFYEGMIARHDETCQCRETGEHRLGMWSNGGWGPSGKWGPAAFFQEST